jgi:hypothetical protein
VSFSSDFSHGGPDSRLRPLLRRRWSAFADRDCGPAPLPQPAAPRIMQNGNILGWNLSGASLSEAFFEIPLELALNLNFDRGGGAPIKFTQALPVYRTV